MMKRLHQICAGLLCAVMPLGFCACLGAPPDESVTVIAEERLCDDFVYTAYSDNTAVLTAYKGKGGEVVLPDTVDGYTLTGVADGALQGCTTITALRVGNNLVSIGNEAFYQCASLREVDLPATLREVGYYAFEGTPWMEGQTDEFVMVGDGLLLKYRGCDRAVTIPAGVKYISDAFYLNEDIYSVTFGPDVVRVGAYAFAYCSNLLSVKLNDALTEIGANAFAFCENLLAVELGPNVTTLGEAAFFYCSMLHRFSAGEALTTIGINAFNYCSHLTTVHLGCGLREVGDYAFYECYILRGLYYDGTADEWEAVSLGIGNSALTDAEFAFAGH